MFDAVVIGDANIDLVVSGCNQIPEPGQEILVDNIAMHVGGGAALFAVSLAKLGIRVAFNGVLGEDNHGRYIRDRFAEYGIDTRMVQTSKEHNTGISIAFNPGSDRSFITYWGSNLELRFDNLDIGQIAQGRHVHLTGYKGKRNHEQYIALVKSLKDNGVTLSCDVGWDDSGEWDRGVFELMNYFDVFLMNETECFHYTGMENIEDSLKYMSEYCSHVVVKLGKEGAVSVKNGIIERLPGYVVEAVDTTGAGDSFNAGYLFGFLSGQDAVTSMRYGNACGALSVSAFGGSTNTPTFDQLERFIRNHENIDQAVQS
ncbi:carbohydrate kinase family protein [Cohnella lupini]|uniref:Sugar/nucleoside kinase (Ribokinase family) n=1 Tax=Cohnella lupini TaxID=1294267 RepID=A0A3D9IBJ1_9BACL|nr:carbohydrate kinase family protein [Cohnella lupini]RED58566.1 sugar/nucleoside kinase (ribokinase family) [Cohnella lupini]